MTHTPGPWPYEFTGDRKRIVIGKGLVEGPHGYEVAEVYSDDCPQEVALANARLIASAPDLFEALAWIETYSSAARDSAEPNTTDRSIYNEIASRARAALAKSGITP